MKTTINIIELLSKVRQSIDNGNLPENWHENKNDIVLTYSGFYALSSDCVLIDEEYFHTEYDSDSYNYDEYSDEYTTEELVSAYGKRGAEVYTSEDNCIYVRGNYYITDYASDNDIVMLECGDYEHIDYAYYWDCDNEWHTEPEPEEELWDYNSGPREKYYVDMDECEGFKFGIGFEIEKNEMPSFSFDKQDIYDSYGSVLERDSSVDNGFELKTATYNLNSNCTDNRIQHLQPFCDITNNENAGGHIGFSCEGMTDNSLLDSVSGWLPLIYAMHYKRINNSYCKAKKVNDLKCDNEKMQSIRLRGNYIEFRIFSAVKSFDCLKFRLNLFRIISRNLNKTPLQILSMMLNTNSDLHKLLTTVYSDYDNLHSLTMRTINFSDVFNNYKPSTGTIQRIDKKLSTINFKNK